MRQKNAKIDELLEECTNLGTKAFIQGFKDALEYADYVSGGGAGELEQFAGPADSTARAKGRELGESLLGHFIY
jgi:hypothetical protein